MTRRRHLIVAIVLLLSAAISLLAAVRRPLWYDEINTLEISRQPTLQGVWDVLLNGVDATPPGFFFIERGAIELLGEGAVALRLPALFGFLAMGIFLYLFISRRFGAVAGIVALVFPLTTNTYPYSFEARPYGMVLGFAAAALFSWQSYTIGRRPRAAIAGLALAGVALTSIHYYAILALLPIAVGEAIRSAEMRSLALRVWFALLVPLAPILAFLPVIGTRVDFSTNFWAQPHWGSAIESYELVLSKPTLALAGMVGAAVAIVAIRGARCAGSYRHVAGESPRPRLPRHELGAGLTYLALPLLVTAVALVATHAFTYRYVLPVVIGAAILFAAAGAFLDRGRGFVLTGLCAVLGLLGAGSVVKDYRFTGEERAALESRLRILEVHGSTRGDIVIADAHAFLELVHAAPPPLARRLVYLANPRAAVRIVGFDTDDVGLLALAPIAHLDVQRFAPYVALHEHLVVLTGEEGGGWLITKLRSGGSALHVRARDSGQTLLDVSVAKSGG